MIFLPAVRFPTMPASAIHDVVLYAEKRRRKKDAGKKTPKNTTLTLTSCPRYQRKITGKKCSTGRFPSRSTRMPLASVFAWVYNTMKQETLCIFFDITSATDSRARNRGMSVLLGEITEFEKGKIPT